MGETGTHSQEAAKMDGGISTPQSMEIPVMQFDPKHTEIPPFDLGRIGASEILHPAIAQARLFIEYLSTPAGQSQPAPDTSFSWALQLLDISQLSCARRHKDVLGRYVQLCQEYNM